MNCDVVTHAHGTKMRLAIFNFLATSFNLVCELLKIFTIIFAGITKGKTIVAMVMDIFVQ